MKPEQNVNLSEYAKASHSHHSAQNAECGCMEENLPRTFLFLRLAVSLILLIVSYLPAVSEGLALVLDILAYIICGYDLLMEAIKGVLHRDFFNEHTLMSLAAIGAILIGEGHEAVIIALFAQIGELLEEKAVGRSQRSIEKLLKLTPDTVNVQEEHAIKSVPAESIQVGEQFMVFAGERVALDGVVVSGCTELDVSSLTGESLPVSVEAGDQVLAGSINRSGTITVEAVKPYSESAAAKIIELVKAARSSKGTASRFVTRFSKIYTPCVFLSALLVGIGIPLALHLPYGEWIHKALMFLVVSCPCALVISIPLSYFAGIGGASRHGILFKNASVVDRLANVTAAAFDKTGTLTTGHFSVKEIVPAHGITQEYLMKIAAYAEANSNHPLAQSLRDELELIADSEQILRYQEIPGKGCVAELSDRSICIAGNAVLMQECRIMDTLPELADAVIHFSDGRQYCGYVTFTDTIRPDAAEAMKKLDNLSVTRRIMITGDTKNAAMQIAGEVGITEVNSSCLPEDKLRIMRELRRRMPKGETILYTGDGINDAPVLTAADVGIAMGALGSDAAIEAADVVITTDEVRRVPEAVRLARNVKRIVMENIVFSLGIKFLVMLLAMFNAATMLLAVFADVGVSVLAILNSIRALKK